VLPFCTGGNLRELLRGRDFVSPQLFFPILQQIAQAVDFAHANGVIHGDIKPENILFRDEARQHAWLADFGISIFFPVSEQIVTKEAPGAGSTAYLSPEQIGNNRQSPASDIYAMAMVAYEALTGRLPFDITAPPYKQMYAKVNGDLVNPLTANGRLTQTISDGLLAGLNIDPLKRPRTGVEFFELFQEKVSNSDNSTKAQGALLARDYGRNELLRLHKILCERFDEAELRTLCFEIGQVDYDELSGSGKNVKARELISYLVRRNRIDDLVAVGQQVRSDIEWIEDKHESS
jgi:serine/threonine protein kinase